MKPRNIVAGAALLVALAAVPADTARATLISNGSFATGDFTGWSVTGDGITIDSTFANTAAGDSYDAAFSAAAGDPAAGVLSQTLTTTPGQSYALSFSAVDESGSPGDISDMFTVSFGGFTMTVYGQDAAPFADGLNLYTSFSLIVPGTSVTGTSTTLSFEGQNALGADWNLDDVSVDSVVPSVPEPSTIMLLAMALASLAAAIRWARVT